MVVFLMKPKRVIELFEIHLRWLILFERSVTNSRAKIWAKDDTLIFHCVQVYVYYGLSARNRIRSTRNRRRRKLVNWQLSAVDEFRPTFLLETTGFTCVQFLSRGGDRRQVVAHRPCKDVVLAAAPPCRQETKRGSVRFFPVCDRDTENSAA